jgi:hypothetical protein
MSEPNSSSIFSSCDFRYSHQSQSSTSPVEWPKTMEVLAPIGFAFGALGFILSTISTLNSRSRKFNECKKKLRKHKRALAACQGKMSAWSRVWVENSDYTEETYRYLWSESYDDITSGVRDIVDLAAKIKKSIGDVIPQPVEDDEDLVGWKKLLSRLANQDPGILERLAVALVKDDALTDRVGELKSAVDNITDLSKSELQNHLGSYTTDNPKDFEVDRVVRLREFVQSLTRLVRRLYEDSAASQATRRWALELRLPDNYGNIKDWDNTARVNVDFTFVILHPPAPEEERRLRIGFHRHHVQNPDNLMDWQRIIHGQVIIPDITVNVQQPPTRKSRPFRELFRDGFFDDKLVYQAWKQDRARLTLALSNWVLLLWDTNWTADLCCHGLRFVTSVSGAEFSLHTLTAKEHDQCRHHEWKLKNFGLVLAEIILATPIQLAVVGENPAVVDAEVGLKYEKRAREENRWTRISRLDILDAVGHKSKSPALREAVRFCLDDRSAHASGPFRPSFLLQYIDKVFKPLVFLLISRRIY